MSVHQFSHSTIDGADKSLADFAGQALLIVNVASQCGLTPHYAGMQALHARYSDRGFSVLGFPCNQFGAQEPGTEQQIKQFCETRFGVTFPMFAKLEVNGAGRHPLYAWLTSQATEPKGSGDIEWNFTKFVIDPRGEVVARFAPTVTPDDPALIAAIEGVLPG
ncbi:MAG TPA: glutathione peroxidase [Enhygromyxa sp.]|nr:glutathione peroxidase [Enhygromyxa sp.]